MSVDRRVTVHIDKEKKNIKILLIVSGGNSGRFRYVTLPEKKFFFGGGEVVFGFIAPLIKVINFTYQSVVSRTLIFSSQRGREIDFRSAT